MLLSGKIMGPQHLSCTRTALKCMGIKPQQKRPDKEEVKDIAAATTELEILLPVSLSSAHTRATARRIIKVNRDLYCIKYPMVRGALVRGYHLDISDHKGKSSGRHVERLRMERNSAGSWQISPLWSVQWLSPVAVCSVVANDHVIPPYMVGMQV